MNEYEYHQSLACPVCGEGLLLVGQSFACTARHSFDIAREGYVNLLLGGGKRPKFQGDSKEMLQARRQFLEAGHYMSLAQRVGELVAEYIGTETAAPTIADVGCGEGWYVGQMQQRLADVPICYFGVDIAKTAVQLAAKRYRAAQFIVADTWLNLPFIDNSITVLLNIFAPRNPVEFFRVLATNGLLLIVIPQAQHLYQLRHKLGLLDIETEKQQKIVAQLTPNFSLKMIESMTIEMVLDHATLTNLLQMTPNYRHWAATVQEKLAELSEEQVTAVFEILAFNRL